MGLEMFDLTGRVAVVSGAASGMGKAMATAVAEAGADVLLVDIDQGGVERTARELAYLGRKIVAEVCDVSDLAAIDHLWEKLDKHFGRVDFLGNVAGNGALGKPEEISMDLESERDAREHVLGFSLSQDVSEREWQIERGGQWVKGKSFPTFNPMGPVVVTKDEFDPADVNLWTKVDGASRQNSSTKDLIFNVDHIVWYVSQCMELFPGDIINTGTPEGVAAGMKPPAFLTVGQHVTTGIAGIGEQSSKVIAYNA